MAQAEIKTIHDHIVILGWSERIPRIVRQLRNDVHRRAGDIKPILIITENDGPLTGADFEQLYFMHGRLNDINVLQRANIAQASIVLIPSALAAESVADGENVFRLLSALSADAAVKICVELASAENGETLGKIAQAQFQGSNIEVVSFASVAEKLLAQAAINPGITRAYEHLLSFSEDSNELYVTPIGGGWVDRSFRELFQECFEHEVILIGYEQGDELVLNPPQRDRRFTSGERIWFIAYNKAAGLQVINPSQLASKRIIA